jgi:hypothetical protein
MNNNIIHKDNGDFEVEPTLEDVEFIPPQLPKFFIDSKEKTGQFDDVNSMLDYLQKHINDKFYVYSLDTSLSEEEREKTLVKFNIVVKIEQQ